MLFMPHIHTLFEKYGPNSPGIYLPQWHNVDMFIYVNCSCCHVVGQGNVNILQHIQSHRRSDASSTFFLNIMIRFDFNKVSPWRDITLYWPAVACWPLVSYVAPTWSVTDDDDRRQRSKQYWPPTLCVGGPVITWQIYAS